MTSPSDNMEMARAYLKAIEVGSADDAIGRFISPDIVQEEFPNRLSPNGAKRDLSAMRAAAQRGRQVLSDQTYEITNSVASDDWVALEVIWTGTLKIPVATLAAGSQMRAHFAVFLQFRSGRIIAQRNYDCFDPF